MGGSVRRVKSRRKPHGSAVSSWNQWKPPNKRAPKRGPIKSRRFPDGSGIVAQLAHPWEIPLAGRKIVLASTCCSIAIPRRRPSCFRTAPAGPTHAPGLARPSRLTCLQPGDPAADRPRRSEAGSTSGPPAPRQPTPLGSPTLLGRHSRSRRGGDPPPCLPRPQRAFQILRLQSAPTKGGGADGGGAVSTGRERRPGLRRS
jgi:hypothetical protein